MAMSGGNESIVGGTVLRIPAVQSPNYVPGVSGWIIRQDGSAEFNNGTFRGSIEVGPLTGQHFIVNNSATGDVVDVYDSLNRLVLKVDSTGALVTYDQPAQDSVTVAGNGLLFGSSTSPPALQANIIGSSNATSSELQLASGNSVSGFGQAVIALVDTAFPGAGGVSGIRVDQRVNVAGTTGVQGSLVQTDTFGPSSNNVMHTTVYNVTTDGSGASTFAHDAGFTPKVGFLAGVNGVGANFPFQYAWFTSPFTATTAKALFLNNLGAALANTTLGIYGVFFG